ncbi:NAD(+) diphosphatase [Desulfovibrio sp. OttesenSCG-928-O18]|nr:NAD(+) diphosphatase [Desulfovibrio sp. OttesenSCG-928-O18]
MLQDISPRQYHPEFTPRSPRADDFVLLFQGSTVLLTQENGRRDIPRYSLLASVVDTLDARLVYLFSVDESAFFLALGCAVPKADNFSLEPVGVFRSFDPAWLGFAGITGSHLDGWYKAHRFCGACGELFEHGKRERALVCKACGFTEYPKISPVIIVGVTDGDKLLVTRYRGRPYTKYALIAGFVEVGETLEDTVRREVMEEAGVRVTNIRYYKSQPWAFSGTLLAGFFADLDGSAAITMDEDELSEATWMPREAIAESEDFERSGVSLTAEMIWAFHARKHPA